MTSHTFGEFDQEKEDWLSYTERLQQYFQANEIKREKQRAVLLSVCGPATYQLIRNLTAPQKPTDKTFEELVDLVQKHKNPRPSVIVQRFAFHSRQQKEGESVPDFLADLRKLSDHCKFGETLEEMLRDRLVCGIRDLPLQRRLLAEADLTFDKAFSMCQAFEAAERDTKDIQAGQRKNTAPVFTVKQTQVPQATSPLARTAPCYRCLGRHLAKECPFKNAVCHGCSKRGHIRKACRNKQKQSSEKGGKKVRSVHQLDHDTTYNQPSDDDDADTYMLFRVSDPKKPPISVVVEVEGEEISMEVDTGAAVSVISEATYLKAVKKSNPHLQPAGISLHTYTGEEIEILGQLSVNVTYEGKHEKDLKLLVVKGDGPSLLGRDWLGKFTLNWKQICRMSASPSSLDNILLDHATLFKEELGSIINEEAEIIVPQDATPTFCRPRPVPFALRNKVENELSRLQQSGVIEPVEHSEWAAPIVPVMKPDGTVRICGDYRMTVNKAAKLNTYPLPRIDDIFASLAGGKQFSKLDVAHAYLQLPLKETSKTYTTISTHKGLFRYNRLPFGISSAPSIFQKTMENLLRGIPHVSVYIDDILLTGHSEEEHLQTLEAVLTRLEKAGMKLKKNKCSFFASSVEYLGHSISAEGLTPTEEKVRAVKDAPAPQNVSQLRSFLGMISYYTKFLPNLATQLAPLYHLLEKNAKWKWSTHQEEAFQAAKSSLTSGSLLVHYDPEKSLILECDASPYGVGAVLSHPESSGNLRPIAYASRSLAPAERNYSQLEREGLAIIWAVKKFHQYLYGRRFVIYSDHKPLQSILNPSRHISTMASARTQRWALTLSAYDYHIVYKPCSRLTNADSLSRLPLTTLPKEVPKVGETLHLLEVLDNSPISASIIKRWTEKDRILLRVIDRVLRGWPSSVEEKMLPYYRRRDELSVEDHCLLWGNRIVIPEEGRPKILELLHGGHPGITRMKALARGVVWWPAIDAHIEDVVKACVPCQENARSSVAVPIHPWEWPGQPWTRIHIDHAGPFLGKMFLVVVDAYSKWIEVVTVPSTNSANTIEKLRSMFATHGLPSLIVSDNGTSFTSAEFREFLRRNGIQHQTIAPYHPSSNGLAERAVQTFKQAMKKYAGKSTDVEMHVARFLFHYRSTPQTTTGMSPAELLMKRKIRTHLDLLRPDVEARIKGKQQKMVEQRSSRISSFKLGDPVYIHNWTSGPKWIPGKITILHGSTNAEIATEDGRLLHRHLDQVRKRFVPSTSEDDCLPNPSYATHDAEPMLRRSTRTRHPPDRLQLSWK